MQPNPVSNVAQKNMNGDESLSSKVVKIQVTNITPVLSVDKPNAFPYIVNPVIVVI